MMHPTYVLLLLPMTLTVAAAAPAPAPAPTPSSTTSTAASTPATPAGATPVAAATTAAATYAAALASALTLPPAPPAAKPKGAPAPSPAAAIAPKTTLAALAQKTFVVALELGIRPDGSVRDLGLVLPSGTPEADDVARHLITAVEPFAAPEAGLLGPGRLASCLVRLSLSAERKKLKVEPVVACFAPGQVVPQVAGAAAGLEQASDAAALLLAGWAKEGRGEASAADFYAKAQAAAPEWDLAARALGLTLVKRKRIGAAVPLLKIYVTSRSGAADAFAYAREIERLEKEQAQRRADFTRPRPRLGKEELLLGVRKGYPLLEPCLVSARDKRLLATGIDTLLVSFKVNKDGSVAQTKLEAPDNLRMTESGECVERTVSAWRFPPYTEGSEVTIKKFPIRVRGSPAAIASADGAASATGAAARTQGGAAGDAAEAAEAPEELEVSTCERQPDELAEYVSGRSARVAACLEAERKRAPDASWPEALPVSFVIDTEGPVRNVAVGHRFFRDGPLAVCIGQALAGTLGPVGGADCPAEFNIPLRKLGFGP